MNPNSIPWTHYQDIQINDRPLKEQFDYYMQNGLFAEAANLLKNNNSQLKGKAYVADVIAKIVNGILDLEGVFNSGVNLFLTDLAQQYLIMADNLIDRKVWNEYTIYLPYNFVEYNNDIYMCIVEPPISTAPTDTTYWLKIGLFGKTGAPGSNVKMKYAWSDTRGYSARDLVVYQEDIYVAVKENKGVIPGTDEATWQIFAMTEKGYIHVGLEEPVDPSQNTIWFRTDMNPLAVEPVVMGRFYRYRVDSSEWEIMYPATYFTWVDGREVFAPIAKIKQIVIREENWTFAQNEYSFTYYDYDIKANSRLEISKGEGFKADSIGFYSGLKLEVTTNGLRMSTKAMPPVAMPIVIKIQ